MTVKGKQRMKENAATSVAFKPSSPFDLLVGTSQIDIGCILNQQSNLPLRDSFARGLDMRLQNLLRQDFVIIKEPISGFHFRSPACRGGHTHSRLRAERFNDLAQPFGQPLVAKRGTANFVS